MQYLSEHSFFCIMSSYVLTCFSHTIHYVVKEFRVYITYEYYKTNQPHNQPSFHGGDIPLTLSPTLDSNTSSNCTWE